jgi:hypothetical protein
MFKRLCVPDPIREITGVNIKGWPIIISHGIHLGSMAIHPDHPMNVTRKHEVHMARRSYDELVVNMFAWPILEREVMRLNAFIKATEPDRDN